MAQYLDLAGTRRLVELFIERYSVNTAIAFKSTVDTISSLPDVSSTRKGDLYVVLTGGVTTDDFYVGPGENIPDGTSVVAANVSQDPSLEEMKWDILGSVFDVSDKLSFGTSFPPEPKDLDQFYYVGPDVYRYDEVTPVGDESPIEEGWFVYDATTGGYKLTSDPAVNPSQTYYTRTLVYQSYVFYEYRAQLSAWVARTENDKIISISGAEIRSLFS